jgi:predicted transcriptional regulator
MRVLNSLDAASSSTYTVRIPTPLKQAFDEVASLHERNGSQLVREFMRDYVRANAKQASDHQQWFAEQVQATRQALKAGKQSSTPAAKVNAWLDSWGTDAERPAPVSQAGGKAKPAAARKRA